MTTTVNTPLRVLPDDVYDALRDAAEKYGGIGSLTFTEAIPGIPYGDRPPFCVIGFARKMGGPVFNALESAGLDVLTNDSAFSDEELGATRISFSEWCRRLNVVRESEAKAVQAGAQ
jgi:hypothetical protein